MKPKLISPKSTTAMQHLQDSLNAPTSDYVVFCGKLRLDRESIPGYLTGGRIKHRKAFFDSLPDRHNFGTAEAMQAQYDAFRKQAQP